MKKWWAVLFTGLTAAGTSVAQHYVPPQFKEAVVLTGSAIAGAVTKKASESNPDGTPAEEPYATPRLTSQSSEPQSKAQVSKSFYAEGDDNEWPPLPGQKTN